jgi:hypothetical protein
LIDGVLEPTREAVAVPGLYNPSIKFRLLSRARNLETLQKFAPSLAHKWTKCKGKLTTIVTTARGTMCDSAIFFKSVSWSLTFCEQQYKAVGTTLLDKLIVDKGHVTFGSGMGYFGYKRKDDDEKKAILELVHLPSKKAVVWPDSSPKTGWVIEENHSFTGALCVGANRILNNFKAVDLLFESCAAHEIEPPLFHRTVPYDANGKLKSSTDLLQPDCEEGAIVLASIPAPPRGAGSAASSLKIS